MASLAGGANVFTFLFAFLELGQDPHRQAELLNAPAVALGELPPSRLTDPVINTDSCSQTSHLRTRLFIFQPTFFFHW